nr:hypothetical protein [Eubacterium sp.]
MKTAMVSTICIGVVLVGCMTHTVWEGRAICERELEKTLAKAVTQTVEEVMEEQCFGVEHKNEFVAAFLQRFIQCSEHDVDMTVRVLSADPVNGLLDIEVCEKPIFLGRIQSEITVRKTVVFDRPAT